MVSASVNKLNDNLIGHPTHVITIYLSVLLKDYVYFSSFSVINCLYIIANLNEKLFC